MQIKDRVVLVTGSSSGIGFETAVAFAKQGAKVVITYNKTKSGGEMCFEQCRDITDALLVKLDITNDRSVKDALDEINEYFGRLDILVNNAGVVSYIYFDKQPWDDIEYQNSVNFLGTMRMTKMALPMLKKRKEAVIINIASMAGKYGIATLVPYCGTKFAERGFTQALAEELPSRIRTYVVNPGLTATRMTNYEGEPPERIADIIVRTAKETLRKKTGDDIDVPDYL